MCARLQLKPQEAAKSMHSTKIAVFSACGYPFDGFAKTESWNYWKDRMVGVLTIPVGGFTEHDKNGTEHFFEKAGHLAIIVIQDSTGNKHARIMTEPASDKVALVHERQPVIYTLPQRYRTCQ